MRKHTIEYLLKQLTAIHPLDISPTQTDSLDSSSESKSESEGYTSDDEDEQILANNLPSNKDELIDVIRSVHNFVMVKDHSRRDNKAIRDLLDSHEKKLNEAQAKYHKATQQFLATPAPTPIDINKLIAEWGAVYDIFHAQITNPTPGVLQPFFLEYKNEIYNYDIAGNNTITAPRLKEILEAVINKINQRLNELKQDRNSQRRLLPKEVEIVKALQSAFPSLQCVLKMPWKRESCFRDRERGVKNEDGQYYMARQPNEEPLTVNNNIAAQLMPHTSKGLPTLSLAKSLYKNAKNYKFFIDSIKAIKKIGEDTNSLERNNKKPILEETKTPQSSPISQQTTSSIIEETQEAKTNTIIEPHVKFLLDLADQLFSNEHQWRQQAQYRGSRLFCCSKNIPKHVKKLQQVLREAVENKEDKKPIDLTEIQRRIPFQNTNFIVKQCEEVLDEISITDEGQNNDYQNFFQRKICGKQRSDKTFTFYKTSKEALNMLYIDIDTSTTTNRSP
ncbi:MAG: hypothetical protein P1U63_12980 [Coxiellaceae bacterium]|nr:hypothetical protein [Coxiellaceae bacterium]